jgi:hypothetical protein
MSIAVHDLIDSRAMMLQLVAEGASPDVAVFRSVLYYVPHFDDAHRVRREQDEVRGGASHVEIRSQRLDRSGVRRDGTDRG